MDIGIVAGFIGTLLGTAIGIAKRNFPAAFWALTAFVWVLVAYLEKGA